MIPSAVLVMTDIVDSTRMTESLGDERAADLWESHDQVVSRLATLWRGIELQHGDGYLLRFSDVAHAVEFAIGYHRELAALSPPIGARVGIHRGPLEIREGRTVGAGRRPVESLSGVSISMVARVMALATGGQTLLTDPAAQDADETQRRLEPHGYWCFKGMADPVRIWEAGAADAPFVPPPDAQKAYCVLRCGDQWLPRREIPHSLPAERNAFVGRKAHLDDLNRRFAGAARLISVVGTGGTGKTRFVQHFGWQRLGEFPGGVWYCDLSAATSEDGVCRSVAQGLDITLGRTEAIEQIGNAIAGRGECLVVLDNFEQVAQHAASTLSRWLDRATGARFVVTSRIVLGVDGEDVLTLPPLRQAEACTLFAERALAIRKDFQVSATDAGSLTTLVDLLDGLPLAIELAAARVRVLSIRSLVDRMRDRFALLISRDGRPSRQGTLRATFDWSWDLLSGPERSGLAQTSVFAGGFDLEAAEAVIALADTGRLPVIDLLQSLVEKSWLQRVEPGRFTLLKSVQEYAGDQLTDDAARKVEERHWLYYGSIDEAGATEHACVEVENLVLAARRAARRGSAHSAVRALLRSWSALKLCGPYRPAIGLAQEILALDSLGAADRALAEFVAGNALQYGGAVAEASTHYENGLALARDHDAKEHEARLLCAIGEQHTAAARHEEARASLTEALRLSKPLLDRRQECAVLNALGILEQKLGALEAAQRRYETAIAVARTIGDRRWEGGLLGNLGGIFHAQGRLADAQRHYEEAIERAQELGDKRWESNGRSNLGLLLSERGDQEAARLQLERAAVSARELGHVWLECILACNLGQVCEETKAYDQARSHYERALLLSGELADFRTQGQTLGFLGLCLARSGDVAGGRTRVEAGEAMLERSLDRYSLALILCQAVECATLAGDSCAALAKWERASAIARDLAVSDDSPLCKALARTAVALGGPSPSQELRFA